MPEDPAFPNPPQPLSYKAVVEKILADPAYAKFIQNNVRAARGGDASAQATLDAHFDPLPTELTAMGVLAKANLKGCTECTTHYLLDFAAHVS